ncbi:MAG: hypothetical protein ACF8CQ_13960 [Rhodopirellula sp. JB044]|uniref:hypothetical protein n=1 Tax=Rhodopirellula sp. JB044 TaxID=3342844 RepID=UPI00370C1D8A
MADDVQQSNSIALSVQPTTGMAMLSNGSSPRENDAAAAECANPYENASFEHPLDSARSG